MASPMNSSMVPPYCLMILTMRRQVAIEDRDDPFRRQALGKRREASEVGHQHRDLALLAAHLQSGGRIEQRGDDLVRQIAAEGVANEAVAQLDFSGEPLQLGLDLLAVG